MRDRKPRGATTKAEVLKLIRDEKQPVPQVAESFNLDRSTVYRWLKAAERSGAPSGASVASAPSVARAPRVASAPIVANDQGARMRELEEENSVLTRALAIVARRYARGGR